MSGNIEDLKKEAKSLGLKLVGKSDQRGSYKFQFIKCGHSKVYNLSNINKTDVVCELCSSDKYEGMTKEEIIANSRFTVGYDGADKLGSMIISTNSIESITPERGFYQALYDEPKNKLDVVKKLQYKLTKIGLYKANLYDNTPNSVFGSQLGVKELGNYLGDYNNEKRVNASKGKEYAFVMPKVVREKGVKALKAHKTANSK